MTTPARAGMLGRALLGQVRTAALGSLVVTVLAAGLSLLAVGPAGALSALGGGLVVVVVFGAAALTIAATADSHPAVTLAVAVVGYGGRVVLLAGIGLASTRVADLQRPAFACGAVAVVLTWLALEIRAFRRATDPSGPGSPTFGPPVPRTGRDR